MLKWRGHKYEDVQKIVVEIKIYKNGGDSVEKIIEDALVQTHEYADIVGSTENHILIFDRDRQKKPWREKVFQVEKEHKAELFRIWGV